MSTNVQITLYSAAIIRNYYFDTDTQKTYTIQITGVIESLSVFRHANTVMQRVRKISPAQKNCKWPTSDSMHAWQGLPSITEKQWKLPDSSNKGNLACAQNAYVPSCHKMTASAEVLSCCKSNEGPKVDKVLLLYAKFNHVWNTQWMQWTVHESANYNNVLNQHDSKYEII